MSPTTAASKAQFGITLETGDFSHLAPMVEATLRELDQAGVSETPQVAVADAGFWNEQHMDRVTADHHIEVLVAPDSSKRDGPRRGWTGGRYAGCGQCSRPSSATSSTANANR